MDLDALGLDMPDIDGDLQSVQKDLGAVFDVSFHIEHTNCAHSFENILLLDC